MTSSSIVVTQGEFAVSAEEGTMMTCILGSCTAACIYDPDLRIGGMNHMILPDFDSTSVQAAIQGTHAMEVLINGLLQLGADKRRLQAKVFGGAQIIKGLSTVGTQNAKFLKDFLERDQIPCRAESLGGQRGRRVQFWPTSGRARQQFLRDFSEAPGQAAQQTLPEQQIDLF